ncbi:apolipoprotein N-acyltransferase [Streptomyces sioyaensis]|uniref:Apolipoprotein N-acyltransferase n=1 Tax=Streptomyces sioyaensis TaxID=67364 RepID=A0A4Q1R406_9ACTN|nr:apolipoprotein N-acyltransferase [Streptomyces sioyaensis]MBM4791851.1 apolipoprotein N-acyltransferase [Streptomyces sioyaensis]RXS68204.1 apolipoprotein N-acyltransferase [Streptomyces sioyaensis]
MDGVLGHRSRWLGSPWVRGLAAALAGAVPALTFPAPSWWWLAYVALVPWLLLVRSAPTYRQAALDGWLGGTGFMLAVHQWLLPSLHVFILLLALLLGALWAPWGLLVRALLGGAPGADGTAGGAGRPATGGRYAAALVLVPSGWLMVELVRSWEYLGGPWGLLGAGQWQVPPALRLASIGGVWLLSLLIVAVNTAVAELIARPATWLPAVSGLLVCALAGTAAWLWAPVPRAAGTVRFAVVQPGPTGTPSARLARSEALTRSLAGHGVRLVIWGESSLYEDPADHPALAARLAALSRQTGAELLVNADSPHAGRAGIYKSAVLIGPDGPTGDRYAKMRLVPFGEYIPFRPVLGWATRVGKAATTDRLRGTRQVLLPVATAGGLRVGPLVCFESAFPDMSRHLARDGAQVLVAQSSTSTFQHSWAPAQHSSLAALRAAENWRPMVHATLTGISAVYGPRGEQIGARLGTDRSAAAVYDLPLAEGTSPYTRFGDWAVYGAVGALVLAGGYAGLRAVSRRPAPGRR